MMAIVARPQALHRLHPKRRIWGEMAGWVDAFRDNFAFEILPGPRSDAVASVDGGHAIHGLGAEIGPPGLSTRARRLCPSLTLSVGAVQSAKVGSLAEPGAGDKEG